MVFAGTAAARGARVVQEMREMQIDDQAAIQKDVEADRWVRSSAV